MITMNDFSRTEPELRSAELTACARVLASGHVILGSEVRAFEQAWAAATESRYAVGVANGLDALEIALRALEIGPGDEVITTPMTAFATILAILRAGAEPVLADIDPDSGLLSLDAAERCRSPRCRAVIVVHLYGRMDNMDRWAAWCERHDLRLIEDCAQAHLASYQGRPAGSWGDAAGWSFYPTKNLGACGDAGALTTNDEKVAERARQLRNYGQSDRYHHPLQGMNARLDELQAGILSARLPHLRAWTIRRQSVAAAYRAGIDNPQVRLLSAPTAPDNDVCHLFVVRCLERDRLASHLSDRGIHALIHYPIPAHRQPPCASVRVDPDGLRHAENHASTCLSLPCHPYLTDGEVAAVLTAVATFR